MAIKQTGRTRIGSSTPKKSGFIYKPRSAESIKKHAEQSGRDYDGVLLATVKMFKPQKGLNTIRILPPTWKNHEHYGYELWVHSYVGANNGSYPCPKKMGLSSRCPMCEASQELREAGEKDDAYQVEAKKRFACYVVDREAKSLYPPLAWIMPWSLDRDIASLCQGRSGGVKLIDHPDVGNDITFRKIDQATWWSGLRIEHPDSPISEDQREQDKILDYISENPVDGLIRSYSLDYLEKVITGEEAGNHDDEDDADNDDDNNAEDAYENRAAQRKERRQRDEENERSSSRQNKRRRHDEEEEENNDDSDQEEEEEGNAYGDEEDEDQGNDDNGDDNDGDDNDEDEDQEDDNDEDEDQGDEDQGDEDQDQEDDRRSRSTRSRDDNRERGRNRGQSRERDPEKKRRIIVGGRKPEVPSKREKMARKAAEGVSATGGKNPKFMHSKKTRR